MMYTKNEDYRILEHLLIHIFVFLEILNSTNTMGIFLWLLLTFIVGIIGSSRRIGFFGSFILSLILSPLIGIIIVLTSQRKSDLHFQKKLLENSKLKKIDHMEEIDRLLDMKSNGHITEDEYQKMKQKIIENI